MADEAVVGAEGAITDAGAPAESGEPTEGATGVAAEQGQEEPDLYTVVVSGKEEKVTFEDLTKGYMRQADYTRKTQELAREREAVAELQSLRNALERDPRTTLVALAGALGVDLGTATQVANQAMQQLDDSDPLGILTSEVREIKSTLTAQQQAALAAEQQAQAKAAAEVAIQRELSDLHDLHGDFDEPALIQFAVDHRTPNLDIAYRAWQYELAQQQQAAERNKAIEAKRRAQVVEGGHNSAPGSVVPAQNQRVSLREAFRMAVASAQ